MNKIKRSRCFSCISYCDKDFLLNILEHHSNIQYYALILHDKDVDDNGNLKEPHFHFCLKTYNATSFSAVRKWFTNKQNTLAQYMLSDEAFGYLTHANEPNKHQYSIDDIISNNIEAFKIGILDDLEVHDTCLHLVEDILKGVDMYTMLKRYGRDYVLNYNKYHDFASRLLAKKHDNLIDVCSGEVISSKTELFLLKHGTQMSFDDSPKGFVKKSKRYNKGD